MLFETSLTATPVFGLRREMNRMFDDVLNRTTPSASWAPPVDVREDDHEIALAVELPGVKPQDVEVTCDNGVLTIRGHKSAENKEGNEGEYHLVERTYGTFTRSFRLPKGVDESKITADFENGVLWVRVPKAALPQPKKIQIGTRSSEDNQNGHVQPQVHGSAQGSSHTSTQGNSGSSLKSSQQNSQKSSQPSAQGSSQKGGTEHADRGTGTNAVA